VTFGILEDFCTVLVARAGSQPFFDAPQHSEEPRDVRDDFRVILRGPAGRGKGVKLKTARDIIDGTFRALYRDARKNGVAAGDPFADVTWPRGVAYEPDPFTEAERDALLDYFRRKDPQSYALAYSLFHTGLRTGEVVGLRWGALDLHAGTLVVRYSRTRGEDNPPKTKNSQRTITLQPAVVAVLRATQPLHMTPDTFVFTTPTGLPLDTDRFVEHRWQRALRATGIRPRKFYATRHTFISAALHRGCKPKWVAQYCGTSLEMLDRHYSRWMSDDAGQIALLAGDAEPSLAAPERRPSGRRPGTFAGTFRNASVSGGGRFEPRQRSARVNVVNALETLVL